MKIKKRLLVSITFILLVCVLIAMPVSAKSKKKKKSLKLNKTTLSLVLGYDSQLKVKGKKKAKWKSSNPAVATVDKKGWVTGVGEGTAIITAKAGGRTGTCTVRVTSGLNITLPALPKSYSNTWADYQIEAISVDKNYDWDTEKYKVKITITVVKTLNKVSFSVVNIPWKFIDATQNIITGTGNFSTTGNFNVGDRFMLSHIFNIDDGNFRFDVG